jgi:hypothetical protein
MEYETEFVVWVWAFACGVAVSPANAPNVVITARRIIDRIIDLLLKVQEPQGKGATNRPGRLSALFGTN